MLRMTFVFLYEHYQAETRRDENITIVIFPYDSTTMHQARNMKTQLYIVCSFGVRYY